MCCLSQGAPAFLQQEGEGAVPEAPLCSQADHTQALTPWPDHAALTMSPLALGKLQMVSSPLPSEGP